MAFSKAKNHHWNTLDEIKENAGVGEHKGELWKCGGTTLELVFENPKKHIALNRLHFCYFLFTSGKQKSSLQTLLEKDCFIFYKLKSYRLLHKVWD